VATAPATAGSDGDAVEARARRVATRISYLLPGCPVNRRFVCAGQEVNTGEYAPYDVEVRDARPISGHFRLDRQGFMLGQAASAVSDFYDREAVDRVYAEESAATIAGVTGADLVIPQGWMVRTPDASRRAQKPVKGYVHRGGVQPPAGEAHVDFSPAFAGRLAERLYRERNPRGPAYKRFLLTSFWRCFSEPPQDWPLALCDARSVAWEEGELNTLVVVDEIPEGDDRFAPIPGEEDMPSASIFEFNPAHRWWYFSDMQPDEFILLKFHDSREDVARRVPHTAFFDTSAVNPNHRHSIEFRSIAYFF
jgi:hypothetical protein